MTTARRWLWRGAGLALQLALAVVLAVGLGTATLAQLLTDWPGLSGRAAGLTALAIGAAINLVVFHAVRAINRDSARIQAQHLAACDPAVRRAYLGDPDAA